MQSIWMSKGMPSVLKKVMFCKLKNAPVVNLSIYFKITTEKISVLSHYK